MRLTNMLRRQRIFSTATDHHLDGVMRCLYTSRKTSHLKCAKQKWLQVLSLGSFQLAFCRVGSRGAIVPP